jgi:L-asparagine oxygenase
MIAEANEMSAPYLNRLSLTQAERSELASLAARVKGNPYLDFESFFRSIKALRAELPNRVAAELAAFRDRNRSGVLLIDGVPVGDLPPTPSTPFTHAPIHDLGSERYLALLATMVAEPFTFAEWDSGHMVQNKYPLRAHRNIQFGTNAVDFLPHSETPFRDFCPDYLSLLCLRADPGEIAKTIFCDIGTLIDAMPESDQRILAEPLFAYPTDNPAVYVGDKPMTRPMPIITSRAQQRVYEYTHDIQAVTSEAAEVLARLKEDVEQHTTGLLFETGMLFIIDNSHMIHGRTRYEPRYDGADRWLQRLLLTSRLFAPGQEVSDRRVPDRNLSNYPTEYQNVLQSLQIQEAGARP